MLQLPAQPDREVPVWYIETQAALTPLCQHLATCPVMSVDLEFDDNRYSYGRSISLIQLFDGQAVYLVDALPVRDLAPLVVILENPAQRKIFHSCNSDLAILQHAANCFPKNLDDTALMYTLLLESKDNISLSNLLVKRLDVHLKKDAQSSNWVKRPLTELQLRYAAYDVVYLPVLRDMLQEELHAIGRATWYEQERKQLENFRQENKPPVARLARKYKLNRFNTALLGGYWELIDQLAAQLDKPHYRIIDYQHLIKLITHPPETREAWQKISCHPRLKSGAMLTKLMALRSKVEAEYEANKRNAALQGQLPSALRWRTYKKHQLLLAERAELFDQLRELLARERGEQLQSLILPARLKNELIWEGTPLLTPWKQEILEQVAEQCQIDISSLNFSITGEVQDV